MKNKEFICRLESSIRAWIELVETDDLIFKMSQNAFDLVSLDATSLAYDLMRMINIEFTESQKNKAKDNCFYTSCPRRFLSGECLSAFV